MKPKFLKLCFFFRFDFKSKSPLSLGSVSPIDFLNWYQSYIFSCSRSLFFQIWDLNKSLQHHFSVSTTTSSEPKLPILYNPLPSLQKCLATHQELKKSRSPKKGSKVNAPKQPSIAWILGSLMKEKRVITS